MQKIIPLVALLFCSLNARAQKIEFSEFKLDNGLHVIVHQDNTAPVVAVSLTYLVGSRNEDSSKVGFTHFFENMLYENSNSIAKKEFYKVIKRNDGISKVKKGIDKTYFSEVFPSNKLELALWIESGRMQKAIIDTNLLDNRIENFNYNEKIESSIFAYRNIVEDVSRIFYKEHPYKWMSFNSKEHLKKDEINNIIDFYNTFYTPNNAILTIAGDVNMDSTRSYIKKYFSILEKGPEITETNIPVDEFEGEIIDTIKMENLQKNKLVFAYKTPAIKEIGSKAIDILDKLILDKLRENDFLDQYKINSRSLDIKGKDAGKLLYIFDIEKEVHLDTVRNIFEDICNNIKTELIQPSELERELNIIELDFVKRNSKMENLAKSLSEYRMYFNNTDMINQEISMYRNISRKQLRKVALDYLNPENRVVLYYLKDK
jgi:zinc protease